jgi:hypothetical protein
MKKEVARSKQQVKSLHVIQSEKMKERGDNEEDEAWEDC